MESQNLFQYQNVTQYSVESDVVNETHEPEGNKHTFQIETTGAGRPQLITTMVAFCIFLTIVFAGIAFTGRTKPLVGEENVEAVSTSELPNTFMGGASLSSSFCKTSCKSACSKFPSVYGELCCEWSPLSDGGTFCGMSIDHLGTCNCGGYATQSSLQVDNEEKLPAQYPSKSSDFSSTDFRPFPVMDFHPFPTMAWLPFDPIVEPNQGTPCKSSCKNPCSQSMSNGVSYCCERNDHGTCGTTQVNGKCWCT